LNELPITLDDTYVRTLQCIPEEEWQHAHRLFQCLIVAIRPLRVEELAELFAIQFDSEVGPKLIEGWRPEDPEDALLCACSSLIAIVDVGDSKIVQFSHFSVKEFLTSDRLAESNVGDISHYHIPLEPAHTLLTKACLTVLLQLDDKTDKKRLGTFPLAFYAAQHWVDHAKFDNVVSQIGEAMECLFDPTKPHLAAWTWIHDRDRGTKRSMADLSEHRSPRNPTPLYYAALCGFVRLTKHLITAHTEDVNAKCGRRGTPLHGACRGGQLECARLLLENGADVDVRDDDEEAALHLASEVGRLEVVQLLLHHNADVNAKGNVGWTALHNASHRGYTEVAQLVLEHGADVNAQTTYARTPLTLASGSGRLDVVRLLLGHGANVHMRGDGNQTPFQRATDRGHHDIAQLLLEHGAQ
jgi:Ankyrin repeats (3 copies)/Ankyrin repeats (many copies)/Ankyrin repeat